MGKVNEIDALWPQFLTSEQYQAIDDIPASYVQMCVSQFGSMMTTMFSRTLSQWTVEDVQTLLVMLGNMAAKDPDPTAAGTLVDTYDSIQMFIEFAVVTRKTKITRAEYDQLAMILNGIIDTIPDENQGQEDLFDGGQFDDGLPQWQQRTADNISAYTDQWVSAYVASVDWKKRPKGVAEDFLRMVLDTLTERAYNDYRKTPKSWTKKAIVGVFSGYFVSNLTLEPEEYALVVPALCALLDFLGQNGWLNVKKVGTYQRYMMAAAPAMIERAKDPDNYGPAKLTWQQMVAEGVDTDDPQAIQQFMDKANAQNGVGGLYKSNEQLTSSLDLSADEIEKILKSPDRLKLLAKDCDPDTQQRFLKQVHLPETDGWRKETAIKAHQIGVQAGVRLWLTRDNYDNLPSWATIAGNVILNAADIADLFYAQYATVPDQWKAADWQEFGTWAKTEQKDYQANGRFFAAVMQALVALGDLTVDQAKQCSDAFFGKTSTSKAGNVVSMQAARKLLKKKKHDK